MYCNPTDFDKFSDDFYIGNLAGEAKTIAEASTKALKDFVATPTGCRRAHILRFFNEEVPFPNGRCGTCDNCLNSAKFADDSHRDFAEPARVVLYAVGAVKQGRGTMSALTSIMGGKAVEDWRYTPGLNPNEVVAEVARLKNDIKNRKMKSQAFLKNLLSLLATEGYVSQKVEKTKPGAGSFTRSFGVYGLTTKGRSAFISNSAISLPVPASIRQEEEEMRRKVEEKAAKMKIVAKNVSEKVGLNADIPKEEKENGGGKVTQSFEMLDTYLKNATPEKQASLLDLIEVVKAWRAKTAVEKTIAPVNVCTDSAIARIAYVANGAGEITLQR